MLKRTITQVTKLIKGITSTTPTNSTPVPTSIQFGLYINGFTSILGDNTEETDLSTFLVNKKVTKPIFYLASLLDDAGNRTAMRSFNTSLNSAGILKRHANVTQSVNAINLADAGTPAAYNAGCVALNIQNELVPVPSQKFTGFTQEWEFWKSNPYGDFNTFKLNDLAIYNYCAANNLTYDIYIARCRDVAGVVPDSEIADWLVAKHDTINLVDYISTTKFNTYKGLSQGIKDQIKLIADAAQRAGKVQKISILWASEGNAGDNMATYFTANPSLVTAYTTFLTAYNSWNFSNKSYINMQGQVIYAYNGIKDL